MDSLLNEAYTHHAQSDETIWYVFKNGDKQAYATLYQRYFKMLIEYGLRIVEDRELVKDCIQDLFIELWKSKESLSEPKSVKAYLLSSIQRKLIRQLGRIRSKENKISLMISPAIVFCREDQIIEDQACLEQCHTINKALSSLTKRQNQAIYLKFYTNLSYKEISAIMSISVDSTYNLISKAIDILQVELSKVSVAKL